MRHNGCDTSPDDVHITPDVPVLFYCSSVIARTHWKGRASNVGAIFLICAQAALIWGDIMMPIADHTACSTSLRQAKRARPDTDSRRCPAWPGSAVTITSSAWKRGRSRSVDFIDSRWNPILGSYIYRWFHSPITRVDLLQHCSRWNLPDNVRYQNIR